MARQKGKGLSGFAGVANSPLLHTQDVNSNVNDSANSIDPLEKLQAEIPAKELTTVMKGIYFDSEVWDVIEEQSQRLGRGGKSKLVNEIVKNYLQQKGLL
ncbi:MULTISPECIES: hypothetical protein [Bacillaceae]|jgi:hypothetical protein|uniref:CopG family transcriptional regulator n=1 Tax=Ectobacillus funiculus TaxID=137993 RepID=A0ABV5WGL7_9BACI